MSPINNINYFYHCQNSSSPPWRTAAARRKRSTKSRLCSPKKSSTTILPTMLPNWSPSWMSRPEQRIIQLPADNTLDIFMDIYYHTKKRAHMKLFLLSFTIETFTNDKHHPQLYRLKLFHHVWQSSLFYFLSGVWTCEGKHWLYQMLFHRRTTWDTRIRHPLIFMISRASHSRSHSWSHSLLFGAGFDEMVICRFFHTMQLFHFLKHFGSYVNSSSCIFA